MAGMEKANDTCFELLKRFENKNIVEWNSKNLSLTSNTNLNKKSKTLNLFNY